MSFRVLAAGILVLGVGVMPVETSARSGGFMGAQSLGARSGIRPFVARPFFAHPFRPERISGAFSKSPIGLPMRERERRGQGFPLWWGYASYLPGYYPTEGSAPYGDFPYPYPYPPTAERSRPIATYQPGCSTQTQKVPSEAGGERTITITRCY